MKNLLLILAAAVSSSLSLSMRKAIIEKMPPAQFEVMAGLLHFFFGIASYCILGVKQQRVDAVTLFYVFLQSMLGFFTVIAFTYAIRGSNSLGAASALMSTSPVITLLISSVAFDEKVSVRQAAGIFFVLLGSYFVTSK
jgi:drug/metabolite transporter (DMT)-like permease